MDDTGFRPAHSGFRMAALAACGVMAMLAASATAAAGRQGGRPLSLSHQQRYSMGTMFDVLVYHDRGGEAEAAMRAALDEVVRLDRVLSHYAADSGLAVLQRDGRDRPVAVDPALYEVLARAAGFSRASAGRFDVTVAPLVKAWRKAAAAGRRLDESEVREARRCVGYEQVRLEPPDRVRLTTSCVDIDLGGIGKGYAVDRALAVLASMGIRRALVNAGGSSIAAIGTPPDRDGWPVGVGPSSLTLSLRDASISTSQQPATAGEIVDPQSSTPLDSATAVSVVAPSGTDADALSTTLLILGRDEGCRLLAQFPGTSAVWLSAGGQVQATYGDAFGTQGAH